MYEKLPQELKETGRFCVWRYEMRKGKRTKVPYQITGERADAADRNTFTDFASAVKALETGRYDGIGLGLFDGIHAIDSDDCIDENGCLSEMAEDIVETVNSYTEISPSGKGARIVLKGRNFVYDNQRYYINNRKRRLEVYSSDMTNKFVTLTGNCIREMGIEDRTEEALQVVRTYMEKPQQKERRGDAAPTGSCLSDSSVISRAFNSKNGEKFKTLWAGEIPEGKSHSEADLALCSSLAFWCGGDTEQMDRLFRQSGLMRDKWERDDYRENTLRMAVDGASEFYTPGGKDSPADDFNPAAPTVAELDPANNRRYRSGDIGWGRLYADIYKRVARYVPQRKSWFVYSEGRWEKDTGGLKAMELCKDLAEALIRYALTIRDEGLRTDYLKECMKWQQRHYREIYLKEAQSVYPISMSAFDSDRYLFNCHNGTLELKTRVFREHRPEDLLTKISPVDYDPEATCPRFESFIDEVMSGDKEKARFLQKALGYGIGGSTRYECMFFLYGELTRNGKGTLMESTLRVTGDYGLAVRPETIAQKNTVNSQGPSEDIARLAGIRFANISEPYRGLVLNAAQIKSMTGNDTLNARFLGENSFDFTPHFKLYVNTNYLPVISDMTLFTSGRIIIVPFNRHFEEWEQDRFLKEEFARPESQSAILNWLVQGYWLLEEEGFKPPASVTEAIQAYSHDSDKVAQFAEEWLIEDSGAEARSSIVYDAYRRWCYDNGCYTENNRNFLHELRKFGTVVRRRPQTGGEKTTLLLGYRLREEEPLR